VNSTLKLVVSATAIVVCGAACSPAATAPPSAADTSSPGPSSGQHIATLTVAGTDVSSSPLSLTVTLPAGWESIQFGADNGTSSPPAGMAFIVSLVDNMFTNPCVHTEQSPKVGPTVADLATALGQVPDTTATKPVQTTIAGYQATYIELAIPATLPCTPSEFYLWQDSPGGDWWIQGLNETARIWILEVGGQRVAFLTHAYPGSGSNPKAAFEAILNSVVFDSTSTQPSPSASGS